MDRSELTKGKGKRIPTTFNGKPAPGGAFYEASKHYRKVCKDPKAGRHPYRDAFGGVDAPVLQEIQSKGCQTIELQLSDGTVMFALFEDMTDKGFSVNWHDRRFPRRWYLDRFLWCATAQALKERQRILDAEKAQRRLQSIKVPKSEQAFLFTQGEPDMGLRQHYEC